MRRSKRIKPAEDTRRSTAPAAATTASCSVASGGETACPTCGFSSAEIRCPRCFSLKLKACSGSCSSCSAA